MTALLRRGTWDEMIWNGIGYEYGSMLQELAPGDLVLDVGCHIGAFADAAASRGARVVGYEAAFENFGLARLNTRDLPGVEVRWGAVWRSDESAAAPLLFVPHPFVDNTGAGFVLFDDEGSMRRHADLAREFEADPDQSAILTTRAVESVALDFALRELGRVRLLKLDVEGAEFPILLTARELARVDAIVAEVHEFTAEQMANLPARSRVGAERYDLGLLQRRLSAAGFGSVAIGTGPRAILAARR